MLAAQHDTVQNDTANGCPIFHVQIFDVVVRRNPSIIHNNIDAVVLDRVDQTEPVRCFRDVELMVITVGDVGSYDDGALSFEQIGGRFTNTRSGASHDGNAVFDAIGHAYSSVEQGTIASPLHRVSSNDDGDVFLHVVSRGDWEPKNSSRVQTENISPFMV